MFMALFYIFFHDVQMEQLWGWAGWGVGGPYVSFSKYISDIIEQNIAEVSRSGVFATIKDRLGVRTTNAEYYPFLSHLAASGRPMRELVTCVVGLAVGSSVNLSQALAQVIYVYLKSCYAADCEMLKQACREGNMEHVKGYVREGMRLAPQFAGLSRVVVGHPWEGEMVIEQRNREEEDVLVMTGDLVLASFKHAGMNPVDFPDPDVIDPKRPRSSYHNQGSGFHFSPGIEFVEETFAEVVKYIFLLPGFRRSTWDENMSYGLFVEYDE